MKMTISIPDELSDKLNQHNELTHLPKSTIIQIALNQYLQSQDLLSSIKDLKPLIAEMKKLAEAQDKLSQ